MRGDIIIYRIHVPKKINAKAIRTRPDVTQEEFAGRFRFNVNKPHHSERSSRRPDGTTRTYLLVIECAPKTVRVATQAE